MMPQGGRCDEQKMKRPLAGLIQGQRQRQRQRQGQQQGQGGGHNPVPHVSRLTIYSVRETGSCIYWDGPKRSQPPSVCVSVSLCGV